MSLFLKKHKRIVGLISFLIILLALGLVVFLFLRNEYALTVEERNWIDENASSVVNINVINDVNIIAKDGEGIFYDFLTSFEENYDLDINPITYTSDTIPSGLSLNKKSTINENDIVFYEDHYVLVSKNNEIINNYDSLNGKVIGILNSDSTLLEKSIDDTTINFNKYQTFEEIDAALLTDLNYAILPLNVYLDYILEKNYEIIYHFSDINYYFVLSDDDSLFGSVLSKYFNGTWNEELYNSYKINEFNIFKESLNISDSEIAELRSVDYKYSFVTNAPYEIIENGEFGGISAVILKEFSDFAGINFNFNSLDSVSELSNVIKDKSTDIYLDLSNYSSEYTQIDNNIILKYSVIAHRNNDLVVNKLANLTNEIIYVQKNSEFLNYLNTISGLSVKTYEDDKDLLSIADDGNAIIFLDKNTYEYYSSTSLTHFTERYNGLINKELFYGVKNNDVLGRLFDDYLGTVDINSLTYQGISDYYITEQAGELWSVVMRYIIILILVIAVILFFVIRKTKKIQIATKIKKDDKMKFIDQLTSLKNRNYLNECMEKWNNNTIYPQTIIVIDLNDITKLNDLHGYNEGDRQIKSFANILIKTQLDNSEIMRTDGNEFVVYLIGYSQKQIINYIHKLNKEVEKLPYENGAKFGYSMIEDNLKTIEDCLNDSLIDMRKKNKNGKDKKED